MSNDQKYSGGGPPPPAYTSAGASNIPSPQPVHTNATGTSNVSSNPHSDYYNASPTQNYPQPQFQPQNQYQNVYPQQEGYPQQPNGYYAPGPQMGYVQQGPYGPQGYGQQQQGYYGGYAPGYGPQGQYLDNRRNGSSGFMEAMLASLACCCCLDACLLF